MVVEKCAHGGRMKHTWQFVQRAKDGPLLETCGDFGCGAIRLRRWENDTWITTLYGNGDMVIELPDRTSVVSEKPNE